MPNPVDSIPVQVAYDLEAERVTLGCLMTQPALIDDIADRIRPQDFWRPQHQAIYEHILTAHAASEPTEAILLTARIAAAGQIEWVGGASYLQTLMASVPVAAQAGHYADRVAELAQRRRVQEGAVRLVQAATSPTVSMDKLEALAGDLVARTSRPRDMSMVHVGDLLTPTLDAIEARKAGPSGLPTGFADLDRLLGGLRPKQLITIAAPTGAGKSVLLLDIARNIALRHRHPLAMFSLEMSHSELLERLISAEAKVPIHAIRSGNLDEADWQRVSAILGRVSTAPLWICDESHISVKRIENKARSLQARHGLAAVIVDYTQLVDPSKRCNSEQEQIADVTRSLKVMAGSLDVPVIAAAQMNRNPANRANKTPELSDLRGSGAIENDSNVVLMLYRPDYYEPDSPRAGEADLIVRKNRNGPTDTVTVAAQLHVSRFVDMAIV